MLCFSAKIVIIQTTCGIANQTLQRTPGSLAVPAGAGGGAGELVVMYGGNMNNQSIKIDLGTVQETLMLPL
jgi:hypothetical protein